MQSREVVGVLELNLHLIAVSLIGGWVLFGLKCAQHFNRAEVDKMALVRYLGYVIALFFGLPLQGAVVAGIYLLNGDKISTLLAFQIGLTSPAIVQSMIIAAANTYVGKGQTEVGPQQ